LVDDDFDDEEGVYEELESAMENHVCPKCGNHLDLIRSKDGSSLRCCNVKCHWECYLVGVCDPFGKHGDVHVFTKGDLVFLRSCASTCRGCEFLVWCDVHKFYCRLGLSLTTVSCFRFVERVF
jgi:ssDNA-binding Zn-finger/Zn-ribbon topoisomerase 1